MITQETPTTGIPEYLTAIGTKIANVVMLLNSPAPNEIKDKYRADLAKIKLDLWTKIEGEILSRDAEELRLKLPNGKTLLIPHSTADLDVGEFSEYLSAVEAWANERGVYLEDIGMEAT